VNAHGLRPPAQHESFVDSARPGEVGLILVPSSP
jgi:hypothetical protein